MQTLTEIPEGVESAGTSIPARRSATSSRGPCGWRSRGATPITLAEGQGFLIPPRTPHNATDLGPGTGRMLSTYIVEIGEPVAEFTRHMIAGPVREGPAAYDALAERDAAWPP